MTKYFDKRDTQKVNGELCITPAGTVKLVAYSAYREFDRAPRGKCRKVLNLILSVARDRGYEDETAFRSYFGSPETDYDRATALAKKVLEFIPPDELARFMVGVA